MSDDRERERASEVHTPEPTWSVDFGGALPQIARQPSQSVADDRRDGEDDVDREEPVEADLEIGRLLDLHEGDVVEHRRQRDAEEHDQRERATRPIMPPAALADGAVEEIEADLLALAHDEGGAQQHQPDPDDDAELGVQPIGKLSR